MRNERNPGSKRKTKHRPRCDLDWKPIVVADGMKKKPLFEECRKNKEYTRLTGRAGNKELGITNWLIKKTLKGFDYNNPGFQPRERKRTRNTRPRSDLDWKSLAVADGKELKKNWMKNVLSHFVRNNWYALNNWLARTNLIFRSQPRALPGAIIILPLQGS